LHGDGRNLDPAQEAPASERSGSGGTGQPGGRAHPKVYDAIEVIYRVRGKGVDPKAVERAIELSETRYCPAMAMVGKAAGINGQYEIEEVV